MNARASALRALVIDDNAMNRDLAMALLNTHGIEVDQATDGGAGLAMLRRQNYDLVLLDISMPGLDGRQICRRIRADRDISDLYVVAYTAHAFSARKTDLLQAGFNDLLVKPVSMRSMTRAIEPLLTRA
jgi:CheY-like chemotaxis protein